MWYGNIIAVASHERHGVTNYSQLDHFFNRLFTLKTKKTKLCNTTGDRRIPLTKGESYRRCAHVLTSSCTYRVMASQIYRRLTCNRSKKSSVLYNMCSVVVIRPSLISKTFITNTSYLSNLRSNILGSTSAGRRSIDPTRKCRCRFEGICYLGWVLNLTSAVAVLYVAPCHIGLCHYNDVIMGAIASEITSLTIVYSTIQIKKTIKAPRHRPLCGDFTGHRWIPRANGQ